MQSYRNEKGFTLLELMIALALSMIVGTLMMYSYDAQQRMYSRQDSITGMQQNLRSGMYLLSKEIRMAGYDPEETSGAIILNATATQLRFTQDITNTAGTADDGDGAINGPNEDITITWDNVTHPSNPRITRDNDGPGGGAPAQPFLDNVDFLEFLYTMDDGRVTTTPPVRLYDKIKSIQVTVIARSEVQHSDFFNSHHYRRYRKNQDPSIPEPTLNIPPFNDKFRRRMLTFTVQCRNSAF